MRGMVTPRLAFLLLLVVILAFPAAAAADQLSVDFETGPALRTPVNDDYAASAFVTFPQDPGFRPYRTEVGAARAHSGTVVADVGAALCPLENTGDAQNCEFPTGGTTGRLSRTATAVTMFAGSLGAQPDPTVVKLIGHRTNGLTIPSAPVALDATGINTRLSVSSSAGDIDSFTLDTTGGGDVAIDDLTMNYPANSLPDVVPTSSNQVFKALQGDSTEIPLKITRVNGSKGPVKVSVSGLPKGVSADAHGLVAGDPTSITLTAADDAPVDFTPSDATITVDPQGDAKVAPAARTTTVSVRVAASQDLRLAPGTSPDVALPACADTDVPLFVDRDISFAQDVKLSVEGLPAGVSAQVLPSDTVAPGGSLAADRTIRFRRTAAADLPPDAPRDVTIRSTGPANHERVLQLHLSKADGRATFTPGFGRTARLLGTEGTEIRVTGNGFCPGTQVVVGNDDATVTPTLVDDHTLTFRLPRSATPGPLTIAPPSGDFSFPADDQIAVDNFRNTDGFQFKNFDFKTLGIDELADAFGADDLFVSVNPCGIWGGNCRIQTGILDPLAAVDWGILNLALQGSGGHCFGISRAVQQFLGGKKPLRTFTTGGTVYSIPGPNGPGGQLTGYLDGQHALQGSDEFLHAYFRRPGSLKTSLADLRTSLAAGEFPIVSMRQGFSGHAVIAYNMRPTATGADIDVHDSNRPIQPGEDGSAAIHREFLDGSVIHVDSVNGRWSFDRVSGKQFRGGNDKTLFVASPKTIPQDPSLPGLSVLNEGIAYLIFGSADGSVRTTGSPSGADYLPALDENATPGAGGTLLSDGKRPIATRFAGVKDGRYSGAFVGDRFVGSVRDVATKRGVRDELSGTGERVTFTGGAARPLTFDLARQPAGKGATAWSATVRTQASAKGADSAALTPAGTLGYDHTGKPATVSVTLSRLNADGPVRFESGPIKVGAGDRVMVAPGAGLASARVTIRGRRGRVHVSVVRNRARAAARLSLSRPRFAGSTARVRVRVAGLRGGAAMGVVVRLLRGKRVVATGSVAVTKARNGKRTFSLRLPSRSPGRYRLLANARLVTTATRGAPTAASATAGRTASVRLR